MKKIGVPRAYVAVVIIGVLAIPVSAKARLGETEDQCRQRYGSVVRSFPDSGLGKQLRYEKNGLGISCYFRKGKCEKIIYITKTNISLLPFSKAAELLTNNSQGAKWSKPYKKKSFDGSYNIGWSRSDGGWAQYSGSNADGFYEISIINPKYTPALVAEHKQIYKDMSQSGDISDF